jgi:hypothetical protein
MINMNILVENRVQGQKVKEEERKIPNNRELEGRSKEKK